MKTAQIVAQLPLADELVEGQRPDRRFGALLARPARARRRDAGRSPLTGAELLQAGADQRVDAGARRRAGAAAAATAP